MKILGINTRTYRGPGLAMMGIDITVVLVAGEIDDYAAYVGIGRDTAWIADHGDKISFEEACVHFPNGQLKREQYRK